jgi:hypothetical protein
VQTVGREPLKQKEAELVAIDVYFFQFLSKNLKNIGKKRKVKES